MYLVIVLGLSIKRILWEYSLEAPRRGASNEYPQYMFNGKLERLSQINIHILLLIVSSGFYLEGSKLSN